MFRKTNLISLGLSGFHYSPSIEKVKEDFSEGIVALGDNVPFETRLAETIEWCVPRANPLETKDALRSEELKPANTDECDNFYQPNSGREGIDLVCKLLEIRSQRLEKGAAALTSSAALKGGRLMVYFPDENLWDGASECASMEFFNVYDAPAWDTWVGSFREGQRYYIVSYIPKSFIPFVEDGIAVNCVDCIQWLENSNTGLVRELLIKGIIHKQNFSN